MLGIHLWDCVLEWEINAVQLNTEVQMFVEGKKFLLTNAYGSILLSWSKYILLLTSS